MRRHPPGQHRMARAAASLLPHPAPARARSARGVGRLTLAAALYRGRCAIPQYGRPQRSRSLVYVAPTRTSASLLSSTLALLPAATTAEPSANSVACDRQMAGSRPATQIRLAHDCASCGSRSSIRACDTSEASSGTCAQRMDRSNPRSIVARTAVGRFPLHIANAVATRTLTRPFTCLAAVSIALPEAAWSRW